MSASLLQRSKSRFDVNGSADPDQFPNLVHLVVRDRDASVGPVMQSVCLSHKSVLLRKSVQHDVAAGTDA